MEVRREDRGKLSEAIEVKWRSCTPGFCLNALDAYLGASNIGRWNVQRLTLAAGMSASNVGRCNVQRLTLDAGSGSVQHFREVFELFLWDFGGFGQV